jgi:hypothetical protein
MLLTAMALADRGALVPDTMLASPTSSYDPNCAVEGVFGPLYDSMGSQLAEKGLDPAKIAEAHSDFTEIPDGCAAQRLCTSLGGMRPKLYTESPWSMPGNTSVRPVALRVSDDPLLRLQLVQLMETLKTAFGPSADTWMQPDDAFHATIFHPDTFQQWRKDEEGAAYNNSREELPHTDAFMATELANVSAVASMYNASHLEVEVDRVVLTSGGVLLLLLRPPTGECAVPSRLDALRDSFSSAFPWGFPGTLHLWHVSLLRLLDSPELETVAGRSAVAARAAAVVAEASASLKGHRFNLTRLLYAHEASILAMRGEWKWVELGNGTVSDGGVKPMDDAASGRRYDALAYYEDALAEALS